MQPEISDRRALLIDAMGTLVRLEPPAPALRLELSRRFGIGVSLAQAQRAAAAEIDYYRAHMQEGRDVSSVRALRRRCAAALRAALPASDQLREVDSASLTEALLAALRFSAFDDARPTLAAARARGAGAIVVSNWDAALPEVLERVGLAPYLTGVVTSASVGARKPEAAIFARALELAGVRAERALYVGDSLEDDIGGARRAGIEAVWLNRAGVSAPPGVPTIRSLTELCRSCEGRAGPNLA
jgi:putative hydrolase of the HAD superfamily